MYTAEQVKYMKVNFATDERLAAAINHGIKVALFEHGVDVCATCTEPKGKAPGKRPCYFCDIALRLEQRIADAEQYG